MVKLCAYRFSQVDCSGRRKRSTVDHRSQSRRYNKDSDEGKKTISSRPVRVRRDVTVQENVRKIPSDVGSGLVLRPAYGTYRFSTFSGSTFTSNLGFNRQDLTNSSAVRRLVRDYVRNSENFHTKHVIDFQLYSCYYIMLSLIFGNFRMLLDFRVGEGEREFSMVLKSLK